MAEMIKQEENPEFTTDEIEKINKLAGSIKESGLAETDDESTRLAKDIIESRKAKIIEMKKEQKKAEYPEEKKAEEKGFMDNLEKTAEKIKDYFEELLENVEYALHIKEKETLTAEEQEELKQKIGRKDEIKKNIRALIGEIKEEIKKAKDSPDPYRIDKIKAEIEDVKEDIHDVEGGNEK